MPYIGQSGNYIGQPGSHLGNLKITGQLTSNDTLFKMTMNGTDGSSTNAGDNLLIEDAGTDGSGANAGDDICLEKLTDPADLKIFANIANNLTKGYSTTVFDAGTKTAASGTFTPNQDNGNIQKAVNGGAHTILPTTDDCAVIIQYTNNASAGTITTSGFTKVDGDDLTTTNGHDFFFYLSKANGFSLLTVKALQ